MSNGELNMISNRVIKSQAEFYYGYGDAQIKMLEKAIESLKNEPRELRWAHIAPVEDELRRASRFYFTAHALEELKNK